MHDDPPEDELDVDEFGNMLDDAPTTPPNPYGVWGFIFKVISSHRGMEIAGG
ncbi:hypothetical protein N9B71_07495 [Pirellulales bacterium]|nr:hypothetical protein [Pirellulales bacterium]